MIMLRGTSINEQRPQHDVYYNNKTTQVSCIRFWSNRLLPCLWAVDPQQ